MKFPQFKKHHNYKIPKGSHGHAKLIHGPVNPVQIDTMINQKESCLSVREEHAIDSKTSTVSEDYRSFANLFVQVEQVDHDLRRGVTGANYFQKCHHSCRAVDGK